MKNFLRIRLSILPGALFACLLFACLHPAALVAQWNGGNYQQQQRGYGYPPGQFQQPQFQQPQNRRPQYQQYGQSGFQQSPYQDPASSQTQLAPGAVTPEMAEKLYNRPKTDPPPEREPGQVYPRLGAEFEPQNAIVISVCELLPQHGAIFRRIAEATAGHVRLVVLFNNGKQVQEAIKALAESEQNFDHVYFKHLEMDTVWLRDFGPRMCELGEARGAVALDFFYDGQRPKDDRFPANWAELCGTGTLSAHWTLHGGNLITNGRGLGVTTSRMFDDNKITFNNPQPGTDPAQDARDMVHRELMQYCNLDELLVLEPLQNESTKHVDMFATFLSHDTVLVARLDPRQDPQNARILDSNAEKLAQVKINGGNLKVHRILVPTRNGTSWSPYTNNIIANKLLLMPVQQSDARTIIRDAVATYHELLPDYTIATVDTTTLKDLQGALHCMSINIPEYAPLPDSLVEFKRAYDWANAQKENQVSSQPARQ